jgi:hypothetical protein
MDMHYGAILGPLVLTFAVAFAVIKYHPPHWLNVAFGCLALGIFAVGLGSKVDVSWNETKGLEMKVTALEQKVAAQQSQIASLDVPARTSNLASIPSLFGSDELASFMYQPDPLKKDWKIIIADPKIVGQIIAAATKDPKDTSVMWGNYAGYKAPVPTERRLLTGQLPPHGLGGLVFP